MAHSRSLNSSSPVHRWPFPPRPKGASAHHQASGKATRQVGSATLSRSGKARDICLVLVWAALIPGVSWLGSVAGW